MTEKRWVCVTCSECFTRRYSADRHIRLIDYIIGRLSGAADPSTYRHIKRQHSMSKLSVVMSHEKVSAVHHLHPQPHPQGYQPHINLIPTGMSDQGTKIGVGKRSLITFLVRKEWRKKILKGTRLTFVESLRDHLDLRKSRTS